MLSKYFSLLADPYPHGIVFHYFHGGKHPRGQGTISADELRETIEFLGPSNILPASVWHNKALRNSLSPNDLCITFDDGLSSQLDIAIPILEEYGIQAFFFVNSSVLEGKPIKLELYRHVRNSCYLTMDDFYDAFNNALVASSLYELVENGLKYFNADTYMKEFSFHTFGDKKFRFIRDEIMSVEQYENVMDEIIFSLIKEGKFDPDLIQDLLWMDEDDICLLSEKGHIVGLHSYSHPTNFAALPIKEQQNEFVRNLDHLKKLLGKPVDTVSYPCNSYTQSILDFLKKLGVNIGFRAAMGNRNNLLELPREDNTNLLRMISNG